MLRSLLEVCQEWGVLYRGIWRTLRVPDCILGGQGHIWSHWWPCFTLRKMPWKFHVEIFIKSVTRKVGHSWGYLEDIQGSWPESWRTGYPIYTKEVIRVLQSHPRNTLGWSHNHRVSQSRQKVFKKVCLSWGTWRTLRVPDQRLGGQDTQDIPNRSSEYSRVTPEIL